MKSLNDKESIQQSKSVGDLLNTFLNNELHGKLYTFNKYDVMSLIDECNSPLRIMIAGEFNAGKSTFINALLGEKVVTSDILPATAKETIIKYGPIKKVWVVYTDGTKIIIEASKIASFTSESSNILKSKRQAIDHVIIEHPNDLLKYVEFIDSPGLTSIHKDHTEVTESLFGNLQIVFWLFHSNNIGTSTELSYIRKLKEKPVKIFGIVNGIDRINEYDDEDIDEVIDYNKNRFAKYFVDFIGVSALQALNGKLAKDEELLEESGWEKVQQLLSSLADPKTKEDIIFDKFIYLIIKESEHNILTLFHLHEKITKHEKDKRLKFLVNIATDAQQLIKSNTQIANEIRTQYKEICNTIKNVETYLQYNKVLAMLENLNVGKQSKENWLINKEFNELQKEVDSLLKELNNNIFIANNIKNRIFRKNSFFSIQSYQYLWHKMRIDKKYKEFKLIHVDYLLKAKQLNKFTEELYRQLPLKIKDKMDEELRQLREKMIINTEFFNGSNITNGYEKFIESIPHKDKYFEKGIFYLKSVEISSSSNQINTVEKGYISILNDTTQYLEIKNWLHCINQLLKEISKSHFKDNNRDILLLEQLGSRLNQPQSRMIDSNEIVLRSYKKNQQIIERDINSREYILVEEEVNKKVPLSDTYIVNELPMVTGQFLNKYLIRNNILVVTILILLVVNIFFFVRL